MTIARGAQSYQRGRGTIQPSVDGLDHPLMWNAIGLVTSGFALVAFIAAAALAAVRSALLRTGDLIAKAPEAERGKLVQDALAGFHIDTSRITSESALVALLRQQMRSKERATLRLLVFALALVVVLASLAAYSLSIKTQKPLAPPSSSSLTSTTATPSASPARQREGSSGSSAPDAVAPDCKDAINVASCNHVVAGPSSTVTIAASVSIDLTKRPVPQ
jgi:hypothetical protein